MVRARVAAGLVGCVVGVVVATMGWVPLVSAEGEEESGAGAKEEMNLPLGIKVKCHFCGEAGCGHIKRYREFLKKFDMNGDGKLSPEEKEAAKVKLDERKRNFIEKFDTDGDGKISREEAKDVYKTIGEKKEEFLENHPELQELCKEHPLLKDQLEDIADRRENVRDRKEDVKDKKEDRLDRAEDIKDRAEDKWDAEHDGGKKDKIEDRKDRREDILDKKEDRRDKEEDLRDRREDGRDRIEDRRDRKHGSPGLDGDGRRPRARGRK